MESREDRIERMHKEIDDMIDHYHMEEKCDMSRKEIQELVQKAMIQNNFAFVLADVANTFLLDCEKSLERFGVAFSQKDRYNFGMVLKKISEARKWAGVAASPIYHLKMGETDNACADSDWWYNFIKLIDDRLGDDPRKTNMLLEYVLSMPSEIGLFNIKYDDFKRNL